MNSGLLYWRLDIIKGWNMLMNQLHRQVRIGILICENLGFLRGLEISCGRGDIQLSPMIGLHGRDLELIRI